MRQATGILAVVPARGGSVRLPGKNIRVLGNRPLIVWTLEPALASGVFEDVIVSTDDPAIADVARSAGAHVPWLRPAELATSTATSLSVLQHALQWYETHRGPVTAVAILQPTSPFRSVSDLRTAVSRFRDQAGDTPHTLVSVSPASPHPAWCFELVDGRMQPVMGWDILTRRSQDLPPAYALNGSISVIPAARLRAGAPLLAPGTLPFVMDAPEATIDIDDADDWQMAEMHARRLGHAPDDRR